MARLHCRNVSVRQCAFAIFELNIQNDCSCLMLCQKKSVILWKSLWSKLLLLHSLLFMASLHCRCICSLMCFCDFSIVVINCKVINKWFNNLKPSLSICILSSGIDLVFGRVLEVNIQLPPPSPPTSPTTTNNYLWGSSKTEKPKDPETQRPRDPETHRPTDPKTQRPTDPQTHRPKDPETQRPRDPETQRPRDLETQGPRNPRAQRPRNPKTHSGPET